MSLPGEGAAQSGPTSVSWLVLSPIAATRYQRHSPLALHPPDLLYMATHDEDRTWRLQGVKWLGVARYSGATEQDREAINRELEKLFVSRDEVFAAMARQSHELTLEDVRILLP